MGGIARKAGGVVGVVGGTPPLHLSFLAGDNIGATVWTDMPQALTEWLNAPRQRVPADLTGVQKIRLNAYQSFTAGAPNAELRLQYSADRGNTWAYLDGVSGPRLSLASPSRLLQHTVSVVADARRDVLLRLVGIGGDGIADPNFGNISVQAYYGSAPEVALANRRVGAVTPSGAGVAAKFDDLPASARLVVSTDPNLAVNPVRSVEVVPNAAGVAKMGVVGLTPSTTYFYGVEIGGVLQAKGRGKFRTHPPIGRAGYSFAFGSCALNGANHAVFDAIRARDPLMFLMTGDAHYRDIATNEPYRFRDAFDLMMGTVRQAQFYSEVATDYVWDDHDFGGNNSNGTAAAKPAAQQVYREYVPHRDLPAADGGIYRTFVVGRVRFVVLDCRSYRSPQTDLEGAAKTMLGAAQKQWLKDTLLAATEPVRVIVSSVGWIHAATAGADTWAGYDTERTELVNWFAANGQTGKLYMICGDMHALAADTGVNSPGGIPVAHAAALDQAGSAYGGPYSQGVPNQGGGRYGWMDVTDTGTEVTLAYTGFDHLGNSLVTMTRAFPG